MTTSPQIKAGVLYLGATIVDCLVPFLTLPLFTRILRPEDFGALALAQVYGLLVGGLANFGMATAYNRNYFEHCEDRKQTGELFFTTIGFVSVISAAFLLLTICFQDSLAKFFLRSTLHHDLIVWALVVNILINVRLFFLTYLRNTERPQQYVANTVVLAVLTLGFSIYFVVVAKMGAVGVLYGQAMASGLILVGLLVQFTRELHLGWNTKLLKEELKIGGPTVPMSFFSIVSNHFDKYLLALLGTLDGVGIYSIGQKIAALVFTFMTSLQNVFSPGVYHRMFAEKNGSSAEISKYLLPFIYVVVLLALCIVLFAEEILHVFVPAQFYGAVDIVIVLSVFYAILFFGKICGDQLIFSKKTYLLTGLLVMTGVANVLFNIPLILKWGALGAAAATLFSRFLSLIVIGQAAQKHYRILWQKKAVGSIYVLLFLSAGGILVLRGLDAGYLSKLILKCVMLAAYLYLGWRLFKEADQSLPLFANDGKCYLELTPFQHTVKGRVERKIQDGEYRLIPVGCLCGAGKETQSLLSLKDRYGLAQTIVFCKNCSLVYNASQFDERSTIAFYENDYRDLYRPALMVQKFVFEKQLRRGRAIYLLAEEFMPAEKMSVLDIGCDAGGYLKPFQENGHRIRGIDLDPHNFAYAGSRGINDVQQLSLPQLLAQKPEPFGMVIMSHVLEHVSDPAGHLRMIHDLLADGGLLYIEVPNFDPFDKTDFLAELQNAHNWYFDEFLLRDMLAASGFQILKVRKLFHIGFLAQKAAVVPALPQFAPESLRAEKKLAAFLEANRKQKIKNYFRYMLYYPFKFKRACFQWIKPVSHEVY